MKIAECLPSKLACLLKHLDKLQQIRIVAEAPTKVRLEGSSFYVGENGLQKGRDGAVSFDVNEIAEFVKNACQSSIYAFEKQIANGYLTLEDGTRIGVSGVGGVTDDCDVYFRSYHSVCIRLNRAVSNCSETVGEQMLYSNILVVGLPGYGKTTFLRDLTTRACASFDVVVLDERGELTRVEGFDKNCFCDSLV